MIGGFSAWMAVLVVVIGSVVLAVGTIGRRQPPPLQRQRPDPVLSFNGFHSPPTWHCPFCLERIVMHHHPAFRWACGRCGAGYGMVPRALRGEGAGEVKP